MTSLHWGQHTTLPTALTNNLLKRLCINRTLPKKNCHIFGLGFWREKKLHHVTKPKERTALTSQGLAVHSRSATSLLSHPCMVKQGLARQSQKGFSWCSHLAAFYTSLDVIVAQMRLYSGVFGVKRELFLIRKKTKTSLKTPLSFYRNQSIASGSCSPEQLYSTLQSQQDAA